MIREEKGRREKKRKKVFDFWFGFSGFLKYEFIIPFDFFEKSYV